MYKKADIIKVISELSLYNNMKLILALTNGDDFKNCITLFFYDEDGKEFYIYGNRYDYLSDIKKDDSYYRIIFRGLLDEAFDEGKRAFTYCNLFYKKIKMVTDNNSLCLYEKSYNYTGDGDLIFMCVGMNSAIREWYTNSLPTKKEHRQRIIKKVLDE